MKKYVKVKLQVEGFHNWPTCNIAEVSFLINTHRHMFHIDATKEVSHNDRQVEIIMLKRKMQKYLLEKYRSNFGAMSCEDIAEDLMLEFDLTVCEVLEDGENGACLTK